MHTTSSKYEHKNYDDDADVMIPIARSKIATLIKEKVDRNCAKRSNAEVEAKIEKTIFSMIKLDSSAASNEMKTATGRFM